MSSLGGLRPAPPEILAVVNRLMTAYFPQLPNARLIVGVLDKALDMGDGKVMVAATGVNDEAGAPFDYIIWFALDAWRVINDNDREALAFHELTHCSRDEAGTPEIKPHDAAVFTSEVKLYGAWWEDAQKRFKAARDRERET